MRIWCWMAWNEKRLTSDGIPISSTLTIQHFAVLKLHKKISLVLFNWAGRIMHKAAVSHKKALLLSLNTSATSATSAMYPCSLHSAIWEYCEILKQVHVSSFSGFLFVHVETMDIMRVLIVLLIFYTLTIEWWPNKGWCDEILSKDLVSEYPISHM